MIAIRKLHKTILKPSLKIGDGEKIPLLVKKKPSKISIKEVIKNYESIFFDSYGVLFDGKKPIDGSIDLINYLNKINYNYFILTNCLVFKSFCYFFI